MDIVMKLARAITALAMAASLALGVAACSTADAAQQVTISSETVVIDVRTPEEFAGGHLEGALNLDVQSASFDALASRLPADGVYVVYCRSGSRAAAAVARLEALGFTALTNAGGIDAAAASTGLAVVR
jgi:rhodanese-related sulfurtransferase